MPRGVDYDLWLGPAPQRPFNPNRFHYNWHWNWDYGTGELGNNGIHALDVVRWLLDLDAPTRVSCRRRQALLRRRPGDARHADRHLRLPQLHGRLGAPHLVAHRPSKGKSGASRSTARRARWSSHDRAGTSKTASKASPAKRATEQPHLRNFLDCIADGNRPNADIEEGHKSTRLCHLGNIALRLGRTLHFDAKTETCRDDAEANRMLGRTYRGSRSSMPDTV